MNYVALVRSVYGYVPRPLTIGTVKSAAYWAAISRFRIPFERQYTRDIGAALKAAGEDLAKAVGSGENIEAVLNLLGPKLYIPLFAIFIRLYIAVATAAGRAALKNFVGLFKAGRDEWDEWDPWKSPEFVAYMNEVVATHIVGITVTIRKRIRKLVYDALRFGTDNATIARQIRDDFGFSLERAQRIAQTEINAATNAGGYFGMSKFVDKAGLLKNWLATMDDRTRRTHEEAHKTQQKIPWADPFQVGDSEMLFPGDTSLGAHPKELIRCRCTVTYERDPRYRKP